MSSKPITFRVPEALLIQIAAQAEAEGVSSVGEFVKKLALDAWRDRQGTRRSARQELRALRDRLDELASELHATREDLATVAAALLSRRGPLSLKDAIAWAKAQLGKHQP